MKTPRKLQILASILIIAGLGILAPLGYFWLHSQSAVAAPVIIHPTVLPVSPSVVSGRPVHLSIPSLGYELDVIDGTPDTRTGKWTLTLDKVQYATPTFKPNNTTGNTLIYGHYRKNVFATLHTIQPGAQAVITTDNGYKFTYTYDRSEVVDPTDMSIFSYQGAPRLTLQTCTGVFFQNRQFFYFHYTSYQKV